MKATLTNTSDNCQVGRFRVELANRRVGGEQLDNKTVAVLRHLIDRAPEIVSIEDLLQAVWKDRVVVENVVHKAIARLRHSFSDDPKKPQYLETVRGTGYRLIAKVQQDDWASTSGLPVVGVSDIAVLSPDARLPKVAQGVMQDLLAALYALRDVDVVLATEHLPKRPIDYVLNSTLRADGHGIVVGMQLVDQQASLLWAGTFELATNAAVLPKAHHAARLIQSSINVARHAGDQKFEHARSPEIWRDYLLERNKILLGADGSWDLALDYLSQLIHVEPLFAGSHQHMALAYSDRLGLAISVEQARQKAHFHINEARRLAPEHWFTGFVLGKIHHELDLDYVAAEQRLGEALENGAPVGSVNSQMGIAYLKEGLLEQAIAKFKNAVTSDPAGSAPANLIGWGIALANLGKYEAAAEVFERASATAGQSEIALNIRIEAVQAYHYAGMQEFAEAAIRDVLKLAADRKFLLPGVLALMRPKLAQELIPTLERKHREGGFVRSSPMLRAYAVLENWGRARYWLRQAIDDHDAWLFPAIRFAPHLEPLRRQAWFPELLNSLNEKETRHTPL